MKPIQFTKEGFENIQKELSELQTVKKLDAVERLQKARAMGDLRENSEYAAAKEELSFIEGRILEIETIIKNAVVAENSSDEGVIEIGCKVIVEKEGQNEEYTLVGEFEANPMERKLSSTSPIGKALFQKKIGDTVKVEVPAGTLVYKIVKVTKGNF